MFRRQEHFHGKAITTMGWTVTLGVWRKTYGAIVTFPPAEPAEIEKIKDDIPGIPEELVSLFLVSNGLGIGVAQVLPIEVRSSTKRTWDSIQRANTPSSSRFFEGDPDFLARFIVFAEIGAGECAAFDRKDGSIWYESGEELNMTSFTLNTFLEALVKEAAEGVI